MSRPTHRHQLSSGYPPMPAMGAVGSGQGPRMTFSPRDAYPTFLSPQETAMLHLQAVGKGLLDACRWDVVVRLAARYVSIKYKRFAVFNDTRSVLGHICDHAHGSSVTQKFVQTYSSHFS